MSRVRMKRTGAVLHVIGDKPKNPGDRFRASASPLPTVPRDSGCKLIPTVEGAAFVCTRPAASSTPAAPVRDYKFDPALHELLP